MDKTLTIVVLKKLFLILHFKELKDYLFLLLVTLMANANKVEKIVKKKIFSKSFKSGIR